MATDPFPSVIQPMLPTLVKVAFSNPDWVFEPKWDGYHAICFMRNDEVRLLSRRSNDFTAKFLERHNKALQLTAR